MLRRFDTIRTARLVMRRWRDADRDAFAAMNADPAVMRYFPATLDRAASDAYVDRIEKLFGRQGFGLWALEVAGTAEFIGFTGLNPMPPGVPGEGGMEVGWRLAQRAWHQGYATEAATAAVDVAFDGAGLDELWSMTAILNEASQAVMRRLGMTPYARFDHPRIAAARGAGIGVIYVTVAFRPGYPEVSGRNKSFSAIAGTGRFTDGDPGLHVHPAIAPAAGDVTVTKRRVSAFAGSDLDVVLRAGGTGHLVLAGIATSGVVLSTLRQAADLDYRLTVLADGCLDADPEVHQVLLQKVFTRQAEITSIADWAASLLD